MSSARRDELTTTSYAILGLLSLQDWSTYELAQQMQRSMRLWWPRAESRVYEEPKRLVRLGLASARAEGTGGRPRTVYAITAAGRRALRAWLGEPGRGLRIEFEAMLKVFFADQGSVPQLQAQVDGIADAVRAELERAIEFDDDYVATGGPFPDRLHLIVLVTDLYLRLLDATASWADDATRRVASWPSTVDGGDQTAVIAARRARTVAKLGRSVSG